jgi:plastocyanin
MTTRLAAPLLAVATTIGLLTLSACGGGSSTPASVPADADVVVKAEEGIQWNAKSFTATATDGKVVIFAENDSALAHNVYVLDSSDKVMGDFIDLPTKGSSGSRSLPLSPGTYRIVCKVPGHNNMNATLTVS